MLNLCTVAKPLHQLIEKGRRFVWAGDYQIAFETLKHRLTTHPILGYPQKDSLFILDTNASNVGVGGSFISKPEWRRKGDKLLQ